MNRLRNRILRIKLTVESWLTIWSVDIGKHLEYIKRTQRRFYRGCTPFRLKNRTFVLSWQHTLTLHLRSFFHDAFILIYTPLRPSAKRFPYSNYYKFNKTTNSTWIPSAHRHSTRARRDWHDNRCDFVRISHRRNQEDNCKPVQKYFRIF